MSRNYEVSFRNLGFNDPINKNVIESIIDKRVKMIREWIATDSFATKLRQYIYTVELRGQTDLEDLWRIANRMGLIKEIEDNMNPVDMSPAIAHLLETDSSTIDSPMVYSFVIDIYCEDTTDHHVPWKRHYIATFDFDGTVSQAHKEAQRLAKCFHSAKQRRYLSSLKFHGE